MYFVIQLTDGEVPTGYAFALVEHRVKTDGGMQFVRLRMYIPEKSEMRKLLSVHGKTVHIMKVIFTTFHILIKSMTVLPIG